MICCEDCGLGDDIEHMFFVTGDDGQSKAVCESCSKKYGLNCINAEDISNAIGGKENRIKN